MYSLEPPRQGGSNEYHKYFEQKCEEYQIFVSGCFFLFFMIKFSVYLNRHGFVMEGAGCLVFLISVACVVFVMAYLLFLLVSLVVYFL